VRDAVGARLARSSPGTRRAVEAAAVIGTRVNRALLSSVLAGSSAAVDDCVTTGILVPDGTGLRFRHELVRMAVETSIAPHRKAELHARLLAELEQRGDADPALLAHHADGAGDRAAVLRHAPGAARRSSDLGAHREAAAQFERALRFAGEADRPVLAALHEGMAGEYALLDRWEEAERALSAALELRRELGDQRNIGEDLRRLSTTLWRLCRGGESGRAAAEAVRVLQALPPGLELAWAYASLGASYLNQGRLDDGAAAVDQARALGDRLHEPGLVSYALNALGLPAAARRRMKELGMRAIPRGPRAATRAAPAGLTAREQEVLMLLSEGLPNREISRRLVISERTVDHHVSAVLSKIGVSSRAEAAREAARMGIGAGN
jgi:DNA-binding CsgD family transcriptional regulator